MIKLFEKNEAGLPEISTEARTIQVFKKLVTRDKGSEGDHDGRKKLMAAKELAFVYWYSGFDSPFDQFTEKKEKIKEVQKAVGLPENWKPDRDMKEACDYYAALQCTASMKHLESVGSAIEKMSLYLNKVDINERVESGPKKGELVHDLNKYKSLTKEMPVLIEAYQKTKEIVKKELQEETALRAGREVNDWTE